MKKMQAMITPGKIISQNILKRKINKSVFFPFSVTKQG